ncbi:MAG: peptidase M23 family protein [Candidatus Peregrinibacteria bacterium Gr01-1014_25]|nr:MAG: peptidase M23 family protein [Candidatus Peregrinibacteria bacterium Gr01-1014_25]
MYLARLQSAHRAGFRQTALWRPYERPVTGPFLRHRSSFLIASLALLAFVAGNMMGTHGWYVFWKSVLGAVDDSVIVYTGTVTPAVQVADPACWQRYAGQTDDHTWRQVPEACRVPLPPYAVDAQGHPTDAIYSVGYMGPYSGEEGKGTHPGIDIRMPVGTPVRAIATGIVTAVGENAGGFGRYVVLRHPNVPDPENPKKTTTLFSAYAHLSAQLVSEGQIVDKGQEIALSGRTGFADGAHLHFQIDREKSRTGDETPWHPYWPFTSSEMRAAGLTFEQAVNSGFQSSNGYAFTIHPMKYVQANYTPSAMLVAGQTIPRTVADATTSPDAPPQAVTLRSLTVQRREQRLLQRAALQRFAPKPVTIAAQPTTVANAGAVAGVEIQHAGSFSPRDWQTVRVSLLDANGHRATADSLKGALYLRTAFGSATFDPPVLQAADFRDGEAEVRVLAHGTQTVVIDVKPFNALSKPLKYAGR